MYVDKNVPRKKRLLPVFIIGTGAAFVLFVFLMTGDLHVLAFVLPAAVLISILNLRMIRVCSGCGRTIQSGMWFTRAEFCSKCGAKLDN
jgi:rRNA maturation endonuclease Nob1